MESDGLRYLFGKRGDLRFSTRLAWGVKVGAGDTVTGRRLVPAGADGTTSEKSE